LNNDFVAKALESARALQQSVTEAVAKGTEQAKPLVDDAVSRAQELQKSIAANAPQYGEAAQAQFQAAQGHLSTFIATGKDVLAKSVEGAQAGLAPLAESARQAVHHAAKAVSEATAPKPPVPPPG
jgi:hypothetical protein